MYRLSPAIPSVPDPTQPLYRLSVAEDGREGVKISYFEIYLENHKAYIYTKLLKNTI